MPSGVYARTPKIRKAISSARQTAKRVSCSEAKRQTLRRLTKAWFKKPENREKFIKAMNRPTVRARHLQAIRAYQQEHGLNFKGGNGHEPVEFVKNLQMILGPLGFVREHTIGVKGRIRNYKVDLAHIEAKIAIECQGPAHRPHARKLLDLKKKRILKSLGWKVIWIFHD